MVFHDTHEGEITTDRVWHWRYRVVNEQDRLEPRQGRPPVSPEAGQRRVPGSAEDQRVALVLPESDDSGLVEIFGGQMRSPANTFRPAATGGRGHPNKPKRPRVVILGAKGSRQKGDEEVTT